MPHRLDSDLLRSFVAVADAGSLTRAGDVLGRTQSALSMQIRQLETLLGGRLLARGPRGVTLTRAGEVLLPRARRIVHELDATLRAFQGGALRGHVAIGMPEEHGGGLVPAVLARFAEEHPDVEVTIRHGASAQLASAVGRGELDLAVVVASRGGVAGELLAHDPTVWVGSGRHLVHGRDPLPLAMFEPDCWWRDAALAGLDAQRRAWRIACTSASAAGIGAAVAAGIAVAVMSRSTVPAGARILMPAEGFPPLPSSEVLLQQRPGPATAAAAGMAATIRAAFR